MVSQRTPEPLRGAFIAIVAAAIGTGGTLAGNAIANANASHNLTTQIGHEDQTRQADLRREAYAEFVSVATRYIIDIQTDVNNQSAARADLHDIIAAYSEIRFVGSLEVARLAAKIWHDLNDITIDFFNGDVGPGSANHRAETVAIMVLNRFVPAGRKDLGPFFILRASAQKIFLPCGQYLTLLSEGRSTRRLHAREFRTGRCRRSETAWDTEHWKRTGFITARMSRTSRRPSCWRF